MDMRQLRYFVNIVECGSLSKASRRLFVAQPSLSQQMARLEDEVGKPLLVRSTRGVVPTDNGEALYHHAKFMLRQLDEAVFIARQDYSNVRGRVALGLAPTTVAVLGLPLMQHLRAKHPGFVLSVVALHSGYLEEMARAGQLDLAIMFSHNAAAEMVFEPLLDEELFVLIPDDSTLVARGKTSLTLSECAQLPLVLPRPAHGLRRRIDVEFERAQIVVREPVAEIDSLLLVMQYVALGGGATIQPLSAMRVLDPPERWRRVPIADARVVRTNYLYSLPLPKLSTSASIVRAELKHVARQLVASGTWQGVSLASAASPTLPAGAARDDL